jgi:hypothetical protein
VSEKDKLQECTKEITALGDGSPRAGQPRQNSEKYLPSLLPLTALLSIAISVILNIAAELSLSK